MASPFLADDESKPGEGVADLNPVSDTGGKLRPPEAGNGPQIYGLDFQLHSSAREIRG